MYSTQHAGLSVVASAVAVASLETGHPIVLVVAGTVAGTAIDADHFPIARAKAGDWRSLWRVCRNPFLVVTDPERIFAGGRVHPLERLLTHVLLGGTASLLAWWWWPALGVVLGASLYVHVLADLVSDVRWLHRTRGEAGPRRSPRP